MKIDIPIWRWNDTTFFFLPSCEPVYPRQGLLGNLLLGFEPPRCAICHPDKLAYPSGPPWHSVAEFFYSHHRNPSLKCIFKIHISNMLNSSPSCTNYWSLSCMHVKNLFYATNVGHSYDTKRHIYAPIIVITTYMIKVST